MKVREEASALRQQGNWQEALVLLKALLIDPRIPGQEAVTDLRSATECLAQLGLNAELDDLLSKTLAVRGSDWRVLLEAAKQLNNTSHFGLVADQKFNRDPRDRNLSDPWINVTEQDRQQSLQWLRKALVLAGELESAQDANDQLVVSDDKGTAEERSAIWLQVMHVLLSGRHDRWGWRLQLKTDLDKAPDYLDWEAPHDFPMRYASVDETGKPIFWAEPDSWLTATSDAQRLRWALKQIDALDNVTAQSAQLAWANFLHSQFSVDTLQEQMWLLRSRKSDKAADGDADEVLKDKQSGILALHTLGEHETIAKLASGIRRFDLPDDLNPIRIYQKLAERKGAAAEAAQQQLVATFMNRRQYSRAADMLRQSIERFGEPDSHKREELDNIIKPRGAFDPVPAQSAGQPAKFGFVFRNANSVAFTARKVDVDEILSDTKAFYRAAINGQSPSFGGRKEQGPPSIEYLQQLFTEEKLDQYVGEPVASWTQELQPPENHWDRRLTITTPLDRAGLYVVDALLDDGAHRARCLVWIDDLAIVRKTMSNSQLVFVADAITGEPVAGANVEFFGMENAPNSRQSFVTQNFARKTDEQGQIVLVDPKSLS